MFFNQQGQFNNRLEVSYKVTAKASVGIYPPPAFDYQALIANWEKAFGKKLPVSADEFISRSEAIIRRLRADPDLAGCLNDVHAPIFLEKVSDGDYGEMMEHTFLAALQRAYRAAGRPDALDQWSAGSLAGQVRIFVGDKHNALFRRLSAGNIVLLHLAAPLRGFSALAQLQAAALLPDRFIAAGLIDRAAFLAVQAPSLSVAFPNQEEGFNFHCPAVYCRLTDHIPYLYVGESCGLRLNYWIGQGDQNGAGGLSVLEDERY